MKTALAAMSSLTLLASAYLAVSYLTLKGAGDLQPLIWLGLFAVPSAIVLLALALGVSHPGIRLALIVVGALVVWLGASSIQRVLASPHFEGYALVLGAMGIVQGLLVIGVFLWPFIAPTH